MGLDGGGGGVANFSVLWAEGRLVELGHVIRNISWRGLGEGLGIG